MKNILQRLIMALILISPLAYADTYSDTKKMFDDAGAHSFFSSAYGYALFPTIGKAGLGIGGSHGKGQVYQNGTYVGDTSMTQLTIGLQAGGQAFSQVIFFQDKRSFDEFCSGEFEFGAQATAVALTAGVSVEASTKGSSAGASGGKNNANVLAQYSKGMAVFTIAKGGLMYEASVGGQKFSYNAK